MLLVILATGFNLDWLDNTALLYGGGISLSVSLIMLMRVNQATNKAAQGKQSGTMYIYIGAVERMFVSIVLFGLGFVWLKLLPVPMIVGLVAGQFGFLIGGYKAQD